MNSGHLYVKRDREKRISGQIHQLIERADGFQFYVDPVFMFALENHERPDLNDRLIEMGLAPEEIPHLLKMLEKAGLITERTRK